ncbi:MazG nucleotide pyrophosphohydrolase domain-containing protein [Paucilactobacillus kaifaensis]|uniref:MazG nucleotide pyrophosphohydrolase domain-containing protein n=1 Tax=Paucilactobacillus kaifaensis TaxID=2559921 RepID=UPI0010F50584|nr:MazG-like family protein [Paucilactobacillus kaifaensis]
MQINEHQQWLTDFYRHRGWYQLSPFIRLNFISEEIGELSRAVRSLEIGRDHPGEQSLTEAELRDNLMEELADALDQLLVLGSHYDIKAADLLNYSEKKLQQRYKDEVN